MRLLGGRIGDVAEKAFTTCIDYLVVSRIILKSKLLSMDFSIGILNLKEPRQDTETSRVQSTSS